ncbi:MAG: GNAT family N-acetyltransferase [Planctomycetes bacterium]|nr:GNAT family N-acetyltransferase [Planctomycetota bacterium]
MELKYPNKGIDGEVALYEDGDRLSNLRLLDIHVSIGGERVRAGGIAGVSTPDEHRGKGYSRKVMEGTTRFLRKQKVPAAFLFGIRHFYTKYGYAVVLPGYEAAVPVHYAKEIPKPAGYSWRRMGEQDYGEALRIYNRVCFPRTGMRARSTGAHGGFGKNISWSTIADPWVLAKGKKTVAYAVKEFRRESVILVEAAALDHEASVAMLHFLARDAMQCPAAEIAFKAPPDDPLVLNWIPYGGRVQVFREADGGPMARITHLESLLKGTLPLLEKRVGKGWSALFDTGEEKAVAWVSRTGTSNVAKATGKSRATVKIRTTPGGLAQLFFGYRSPEEMMGAGAVKASGKVPLAAKMFPMQYGHMMQRDHF